MDALLTGAVPTVTEGGEAKALDLPPLPPSLAATAKNPPLAIFRASPAVLQQPLRSSVSMNSGRQPIAGQSEEIAQW